MTAAFMSRGAWSRAELIGRAPDYIQNDAFINALNTIDINEMNPSILRRKFSIFAAFSSVTGLDAQVRKWLNS